MKAYTLKTSLLFLAFLLPVGVTLAQYRVYPLTGTVYEVGNLKKPLRNAKIIFIVCYNQDCPDEQNPFATTTSDRLGHFKVLLASSDYKVIVSAADHCDSVVLYSPNVHRPSDVLARDFYLKNCRK